MEGWHFSWYNVLAGAAGGFIYSIRDGDIELPRLTRNCTVNLGFIAFVLMGAFAGFLMDTHPALCAVVGYAGSDFINALYGVVRRRILGLNGQEKQVVLPAEKD